MGWLASGRPRLSGGHRAGFHIRGRPLGEPCAVPGRSSLSLAVSPNAHLNGLGVSRAILAPPQRSTKTPPSKKFVGHTDGFCSKY